MRFLLALFLGFLSLWGSLCVAYGEVRDIFPDTWVGIDGLGRKMPDSTEVGPPKTDKRRVVGIFYITWHGDGLAKLTKSPYSADVTKILQKDPSARFDAQHPLWTEGSYHWGEPECGYFLSRDEYVIRKDMSMLSDAGVDVLVMDVTNAVLYWDEWDTLFTVMQKMKSEGNRVPQFCFWSFNGPSINVVQDLYERIYKQNRYQDLWFYWEGKPLLLYNGRPEVDSNGPVKHPNRKYDPAAKTDPNHPHYGDPLYTEEFLTDYSQEVKDFFTLRTMWWGYYEWAGKRAVGTEGYWSFGYGLDDARVKAMNPDDLVSPYKGIKEQAAVTPAQHPISLVGKSWSREYGEPELNEYDLPIEAYVPWLGRKVKNPEAYGIYFQERWDEALKSDPDFIYINDWNEWTAGKYQPGEGKTIPFMRRESPYFFVDQYNAEFNRTIQPMKGGYTDNYYMQMVQNIRRYKGVRSVPVVRGIKTITVDGQFDDWESVAEEFRDTVGDTFHRDYDGYGGLHYRDDSGRNDIITSKFSVDSQHIFFFAEANKDLVPCTEPNWMVLFIDSDQNAETGWEGFDYVINLKVVSEDATTLMRYSGGQGDSAWVEVSQLPMKYVGKKLELSVRRELLGLTSPKLQIDFKWADNPRNLDDIIALCTSGDTAPNRRFKYRVVWTED